MGEEALKALEQRFLDTWGAADVIELVKAYRAQTLVVGILARRCAELALLSSELCDARDAILADRDQLLLGIPEAAVLGEVA